MEQGGRLKIGTGDKLDTQETKVVNPGSAEMMQPKTKKRFWAGEEADV